MKYSRSYGNALQSGLSFLVSSVFHRPVVYGYPPSISLELTNHCNLSCPECPSGSGKNTRKRGFMKIEMFRSIIDELRPCLLNMNLYFQGEPMLHPDLFPMIEYSRGLQTTLSTNGHFLHPENAYRIVHSGLRRLIISLDGLDHEAYSSYRVNGSLHIVLDGIRNVTGARRKVSSDMKIFIQVLVNRKNEHQIPAMKKLAAELETGLILKSMQLYGNRSAERWLPSRNEFRRYINEGGTYRLKSSFPRRCARLWFNPVVTWDGMVVPCCFDKDAGFILGDLNVNSFGEIWHGEKYRNFRRLVLTARERIDICRNCTSGLRGAKK